VGRLFGTDGVRGLANGAIDASLALRLAEGAARVLGEQSGANPGGRPLAVVGRDPRASGEFLESAVVAGLAGAGMDVLLAGVIPTPGLAYLTAAESADLGVMISASHNPMPDNGIKFFSAGGHKLPDHVEDAIEATIDTPWARPTGAGVGRVRTLDDATARYVQHLVDSIGQSLSGLTVVVDCANGAASQVAPDALRRAGAEVTAIHANPDGLNINEGCGSTHLDDVIAAVTERGADIGIAHDGDADRCLAIDANGQVVDGDQIMAILALAMRDSGELAQNTVVATVMSNLGFALAMEDAGIEVVRTSVGDRYVLEEMLAHGYTLGGEQSGHVVLSQWATTGDGVLTALMLLARMAGTGRSLADLASVVTRLPQVLVNVPGVDRAGLGDAEVMRVVADVEARLGDTGRVLLRSSGTEPLVRVMVEAPTLDEAGSAAEDIAAIVRDRLSLPS